jgi:hypothetical protein
VSNISKNVSIENIRTAFTEDEINLILWVAWRLPIAIWAAEGRDEDYAIRLWTPGAEKLYGFSKQEALNKNYLNLFVDIKERIQAEYDHEKYEGKDEFYSNTANDITSSGKQKRLITQGVSVKHPGIGRFVQLEVTTDASLSRDGWERDVLGPPDNSLLKALFNAVTSVLQVSDSTLIDVNSSSDSSELPFKNVQKALDLYAKIHLAEEARVGLAILHKDGSSDLYSPESEFHIGVNFDDLVKTARGKNDPVEIRTSPPFATIVIRKHPLLSFDAMICISNPHDVAFREDAQKDFEVMRELAVLCMVGVKDLTESRKQNRYRIVEALLTSLKHDYVCTFLRKTQIEIEQKLSDLSLVEVSNQDLSDWVKMIKFSLSFIERLQWLGKPPKFESLIKNPAFKHNLYEIVESAIRMANHFVEDGVPTVVNEIPRNYFVFAEWEIIETVFFNFIINARKFTPGPKKATEDIVISATKLKLQRNNAMKEFVEVSIEDGGEGLPPSIDPMRLFDRGVSENPGKRDVKGTGLGLYFVKLMIQDALYGEIVTPIRNHRGGSTFSFRYPLS